MKNIKDLDAFISTIELAFENCLEAFVEEQDAVAKDVHARLSSKRKFIFFRRYKNLPEPVFVNVIELLDIANEPTPQKLVDLEREAIKFKNLLVIANKCSKLDKYEFVISKEENVWIEDWAKGKGSDNRTL